MQSINKIRIALQRSGRLAAGSLALLARCGIALQATPNQLFVRNASVDLDFVFARDDDIPELVERGSCDLGIVGKNVLDEYCSTDEREPLLQAILPLGFSRCRLSIATPKTQAYQTINALNGKVIATSYPNLLRRFLQKNNVAANIIMLHGSVELAPQLGMADAICDLVASGATLTENGLQELITVSESEAMLIRNCNRLSPNKQNIVNQLLLKIKNKVLIGENDENTNLARDQSSRSTLRVVTQ